MESIFFNYIVFASFVLVIQGIDLKTPNNADTEFQNEETREPRASRRVVKLYSGARPKPIECIGEGFQADSDDCSTFHRCVKSGNGRYLSFKFQCGPGTIYDPDAEICNHPENTKRSECGGKFIRTTEPTYENEISKEVPSPISTKDPVYFEGKPDRDISTSFSTTKSSLLTEYVATKKLQTTTPEISKFSQNLAPTLPTSVTFINRVHTSQPGEICISDGFMGDSENCRKFYRCVGNQRGGFIRYEFFCSEPTIWDDDKQSCNHAWLVYKRRCGRESNADIKFQEKNIVSKKDQNREINKSPLDQNNELDKLPPVDQIQLQINYGSKVSQQQTQISKGKVKQNQTQINYNKEGNSKQNQTQISHGSAVSQSQSQINYGDKGVQTQLQIDHSNESSQSQTQIVESTTGTGSTQISTKEPVSNNRCTESGFIGDSKDCKKFYRCVDNGRGSFTRYEFSCGEGTVWDPKIESCNHAWAVKECGGTNPSESSSENIHLTQSTITFSQSTTTLSTTTSTQNYYISEEPVPEENNDLYGNQQTPASTSKPIRPVTTTTKAPHSLGNNKCKSSGFMGDNSDCKKFYRCVDNGNGQFTRYEFNCGEGTVWDSKIDACNHAWAVEKCGGNHVEGNNDEFTTIKETQTTHAPTQPTSQIPSLNDDYETGYGQQHDETSSVTTVSKTTTTTTSSLTSLDDNSDNICESSGFMGDNNDCKKFYRCVDNGNGAYTRYEFNCGEGTVWDSKIEACNHAWAVEKCGGLSTEDINKIDTTTQKDYENTTHSTTQSLAPVDENDTGYNEQNNGLPKPISTTTSTIANDNICTNSGFKGDSRNCKKFYRCVDDGRNGYIQYEFTCGEGTVWDQSIEACNHEWAVSNCTKSGQNNSTNGVESTTKPLFSTTSFKPEDQQNNQPSQESSTFTNKPMSDTCFQEGFYADTNNCKNFYRCVDNGQGGYTKYEFSCGEGTVWNQEIKACDHESENKQCGLNNSKSTTKIPITENDETVTESATKSTPSDTNESNNEPQASQPNDNKCINEGFYGDSNNCKNFYRCVDNGQGGYTKYEFTCGDGTIWDQEILACNHDSNNSSCKNNIVSASSTTSVPDSENTQNSTISQQEQSSQTTESSSAPSTDDKCTEEGFHANSKDCKKFYRCVRNDKGLFTKYEFSCGDGTIWVQEIQACDHDNGIVSCANNNSSYPQTTEQIQNTTSTTISTTQESDKDNDEYSNGNSEKPILSNKQCTSEGFYGNTDDCRQFYRCVNDGKGGYIKYDFTCGEGTAWDSNIQTCNHISEVQNCNNQNEDGSQMQPAMHDDEMPQTSDNTSTTQESTSSESSKPNNNSCEHEGYFGNTQDCTKFYRCVDNGKGGFTKYEFDCGEGTIWDQDVTTCNHPQDVTSPSCTNNQEASSSPESSSSTTSSTISSSTGSTTSEMTQDNTETNNSQDSSCANENTSKNPDQQVKCEKAGYFADPNDCKKFYRCVDWDGNGEKFSVFHFECGEGTIWDPQLDTCNHEDSVYPPRDCSGSQNYNESTSQETTTSTEKSTTQESTSQSTTTQQSSSSKQTTQQTTTNEQTTQESTTSEQTTEQTAQESTTSEQTTQQSTTNFNEQTTQRSTTSEQTTEQSTTSEQTTAQSTTSEQTTQQSTTSEQTTTQQSTTEQTTTTTDNGETSTTDSTEHTTTKQTTTEQSTNSENTSTTEQSTSTEEMTDHTTTEQQTTDDTTTTESSSTTTEKDDNSTTESSENTTTNETSNQNKECPETEDDQYLYVCPTSFKRHPKYCNMFYQCTEDEESHEIKIATFMCPNNTIYDESQTRCVKEDEADKKCDGQRARKHRVKRLNLYSREPIEVDHHQHKCNSVGYYPFEKDNECSRVFLKCQQTRRGKLRGHVYQCPEGYVYWTISKRCEKTSYMKYCQPSKSRNWNNRWEIPVEKKNIAK